MTEKVEGLGVSTRPPNASRRYIVGAVLVAALAAGGYGGTQWWRDHQAETASLPAVKLASIHLTNVLRLKSAESATFKEYFEKADSAVSEIDKASIALRSTADITHPKIAQAVSYMETAQEAARACGMLMRKRMAFSSAMKGLDYDDLPTGSYMAEYRLQRMKKALEEAKKARAEYADAASGERTALVALRTKNTELTATYGQQVAIDPKALDENLKDAEETQKSASKPV
jgi:predicted  nucleic acid-binding Zn-ribbon protein